MPESTIMFVDDDMRVLRSLKALFRNNAYKVITVDDGHDALEITKQQRVHVVVSDQRMPKMRGVDLLAKMKEVSPNTMRLLLTGYADVPAVVDSINKGEVFRYVTKPWEVDDITEVVGEAASISHKLFEADRSPTKTLNIEAESAPNDSQHIVVFEPNQEILAFIESMFGKQHTVHYANSVDRALEYFIDFPIALVITYIDKTQSEQIDFLKQIKQNYPLATTIAVMSQTDAQVAINLINQGQVYRYLPTPISPGRMNLSVKSALNYHNQMARNPVLLSRHNVKPIAEESPTSSSVSSGFISRIGILRSKLMERLRA
ncbi:MAG: response regulator [Pseudomonadota bacterium]